MLYSYRSYYSVRITRDFSKFFPTRIPQIYKFPPSKKFSSFAIDRSNEKRRGLDRSNYVATSTMVNIRDIGGKRRWREESGWLVRKGNMCEIIRNCSRRCRLNPISPVSISSRLFTISANNPPFSSSSLRLTFTTPPSVPLALTYSITHRPTTGRGFILRFVQTIAD